MKKKMHFNYILSLQIPFGYIFICIYMEIYLFLDLHESYGLFY